MMPFRMCDKDSLPLEVQHYWPLVEACRIPRNERHMIGYLTIHESHVKKGETQRRLGVHIESPGEMRFGGELYPSEFHWGGGFLKEHVEGGLYMASNVENSCRVWNKSITSPALAAGHLGDMEHMKTLLGEGEVMEANKMYWLTDKTPH